MHDRASHPFLPGAPRSNATLTMTRSQIKAAARQRAAQVAHAPKVAPKPLYSRPEGSENGAQYTGDRRIPKQVRFKRFGTK